MEDLWKVTRIDYRIATISEQGAYAEIVRRYHQEEGECESSPLPQKTAHRKMLLDE